MAESRVNTKRVSERVKILWKTKKEKCWKPENVIFESQKTKKHENICAKSWKTVFENYGNRRAILKRCGKHQRDNEKWRKPEHRKKCYGKPEKHKISCGKQEQTPDKAPLIRV